MQTGRESARWIESTWMIAAAAALTCAASAPAQDSELEPPLLGDAEESKVEFTLSSSFEYQFEGDFNEGGAYEVWRAGIGMAARTYLLEDLKMAVGLGYEFNSYDFDTDDSEFSRFADMLNMPDDLSPGENQPPGGNESVREIDLIGPNPWDEIHSIDFSIAFTYDLDENWSVFAAPLIRIAFESGADIGDSIMGGAYGGVVWRINEDLTVGGGFGGMSQIEDSERYFPVIIMDWKIIEGLRLSNQLGPGRGALRNGLELSYNLTDKWDIALGGAYEYRRFRLDDDEDEIAPDGVGFEERIPIYLRTGYRFTPDLAVSVYGGFSWDGQVEIQDSRGQKIVDDEPDDAPFVAAALTFRF